MTSPTLSVVCPMYNAAEFIGETLKSIQQQTLLPFELLVIDDGSADKSCAVVEEIFAHESRFTCRLIRNPHLGPGAARNKGIELAQGSWIAFLDSDDLWKPEKLSVVEREIRAHPLSNFFCHHEEHLLLSGERKPLEYSNFFDPNRALAPQLYRRCIFSTSAVTCSKDLLMTHGRFDEILPSSQDYELWLRLSPVIKVTFIREILGVYRDRKGNITSSPARKRLKNLLIIYLRHLDKSSPKALFEVLLRWVYAWGASYCVKAAR